MRGRFCTQPFLVERSACRPNAFLLPLRWVSRSPPHLPQCAHWGTFPPRGRLWVEKNLASQTSGPRKGRNKIQFVFCTDMCRAKNSSHPESASFAGAVRGASPNFGIPAQRVPKFLPLPARPAGGRAVTGVGSWAAGQAKKKESPRRAPQPEKVGPGRKNLFLPGVLSPDFLQRKSGSPAGVGGGLTSQGPPCNGSNGATTDDRGPRPSFPPFLGRNGGPRRVGALRGAAPRGTGKAPTTRRVRSTPPGRRPPRRKRNPKKEWKIL